MPIKQIHFPRIEGTCTQKCPDSEIQMREKEKLLHQMEMLQGTEKSRVPQADRNKMIKKFSRSAAGQCMQDISLLRPYKTLRETVIYLLQIAIANDDFPYHIRYDFVADRLRAVRQDMVIQDLPKLETISLLQPIVRFYAFSSYRLADSNGDYFDTTLNNKHLQDCIKQLLVTYDDWDISQEKNSNLVEYKSIDEDDARPMIEAIYILFNLGETEAIWRALTLPQKWKTTCEVQKALAISLLFRNKNYVQVCKRIRELPHLLHAVAALHLPRIRKMAFCIMSVAYNSRNLIYPIKNLMCLLNYNDVIEMLADAKHLNLKYDLSSKNDVDNGTVQFMKDNFNFNVNLTTIHKQSEIDLKLSAYTIPDIIFYGSYSI